MSENTFDKVVVHPLVLLSVVDHFKRSKQAPQKRVVGCLLTEGPPEKTLHITNSFAIPFDEKLEKPDVWFIDHNFLETMFEMHKKVNAKERIVGWYSTGPSIRKSDLDIHEIFRKYTQDPAFVIINVHQGDEALEIPVKSFRSIEEVKKDGQESKRTFKHCPSEVGAFEAEEVGVEHLLRDIKDTTVNNLTTNIGSKISALKGFKERLNEMSKYLQDVLAGKLQPNHLIISNIQDIFNIGLNLDTNNLNSQISITNNDMTLTIYLSSMVRSVIALHDLIENKIQNREIEKRLRMESFKKSQKKEEEKLKQRKENNEKKK
ncbi:26s proteasome non-atpase regulatory subunit 7 [Anaeramoeba flamelloides]|uniref:26s proteasome non-atpase regulatory subunit n=1 Tax=Anaeramoeba flamelloides TaxID=1746091 RepID=A0AAV7YRZ3_9EUKA|nr:26s proteasome non-atpase regulatory subunit [Anaeramoeba flamelloides]KAJ6255214.1 26s proteasome non-atpase regulatory subunit 7 [Anaeramoeba flamelloides]